MLKKIDPQPKEQTLFTEHCIVGIWLFESYTFSEVQKQ